MIEKKNILKNLVFLIFLCTLIINCLFIYFFLDRWISIYYFYFLVLFLFLLVSSFFCFFVNNIDKKKKYLTVLISIFFSVFFVEYILMKTNSLKLFDDYIQSKKHNIDYDFRSKAEVIKEGKNLYPSMHVLTDKYIHADINMQKMIPLSGVSNSETVLCNENGFWAKYNSDRYGFRNPDNVWDENEIEYLILGDSYAHGACVEDKNTFRDNLERLSGKSAINLGIGGNGPLMSLGAMIEYGFIKKPNKIVWLLNIADISDTIPEIENKILIKYIEENNFSQNLKNRSEEINLFYDEIIQNYLKKRQSFFKFIRIREVLNIAFNTYTRSKIKKPLLNDYMFNSFRNVAEKIIYTSKLYNAELYIVYLPIHWEYSKKPPTYKKYRKKMIKFFEKNNITVIDLHKEKWITDKDFFKNYVFSRNLHYTPIAYNEISEIIFNKTKF